MAVGPHFARVHRTRPTGRLAPHHRSDLRLRVHDRCLAHIWRTSERANIASTAPRPGRPGWRWLVWAPFSQLLAKKCRRLCSHPKKGLSGMVTASVAA